MSPTDYCLYSTKLFFTLTCTEKPLKFNSNKFFSIYNYLFRFFFLYSVFNEQFCRLLSAGGDDGIRTHDPLLAGQVLSQLSYTPMVMGFPF